MAQKKVVIVGAGLVGSLLGIFLARRGYTVQVYERRADMRKEVVEAGRSINLALSDRGIQALKLAGIAEEILQRAIAMPGRLIHHPDQTTAFQPYGKEGQAIYSVSRGELNKQLVTIAEAEGVVFYFNKKCSSIDWKTNEMLFEDGFSTVQEHVRADLVFGADGAYSATRLQHMLQHQKFEYLQTYIDCGYKEIAIPAGRSGEFLLDKNALHIWPRQEYMLIALPNQDGSFTGTLFFPFEGELSFDKLDTAEKVHAFFAGSFPDVVSLVPDLTDQFFTNPVASLVTVKCYPWVRDGSFALIGDAAHALVPFFGQGMNCGFEDCYVLDKLLEKHQHNWTDILAEFQQLRKPDADAIADMAISNFTEMRAKTADPKFLLQKKIEARLHEKFPQSWIPAYSQVTFSPHIRYSEAKERGRMQEAVMQEFMQMPGIEKRWDDDTLHRQIISSLPDQKN